MTPRKACLYTSMVLALVLTVLPRVWAQDANNDASRLTAADFKGLSNDQLVQTRDALLEEIQVLASTIDNLTSVVSYLDQFEAASTPAEKQKFQALIANYEQWAGLQKGDGTDKSKVTAVWHQTQAEKARLAQRRRAIDSEISSRLAAQSFKAQVSLYGAGIVTIVVVGFFWTASRSRYVVTKIFGGQEGLQFITLFSLVVAIILFGVTGVLEGKELSALLGGLAGYILGRSNASPHLPEEVRDAIKPENAS